MTSPRLHLIIPAFNEQECLPKVLSAVNNLSEEFVNVLVVDNASTDQTPVIAKEYGAKVLYEPYRGYGSACLRGVSFLSEQLMGSGTADDILVFLDADYSDYPEDLSSILALILEGGADFVVGSRLSSAKARKAVPAVARLGNTFAMWVLKKRYRVTFSDMGPFRAITWPAFCYLGMKDRTWGWTLEMQLKAAQLGLGCAEVSVRYRERGAGKSKISQSLPGAIRAASKILWVLGMHLLFSKSRPSYSRVRKFAPEPVVADQSKYSRVV